MRLYADQGIAKDFDGAIGRNDAVRYARPSSAFVRADGAPSIAMIEQLIGCPHEEGVGYPTSASCPACPYWAGRDRWAGVRGDDAVA